MTEKDQILGRIREALNVPAPVPGSHGGHEHSLSEPPSASNSRQWLPRVGPGFDERLALFQKNADDLKAEFHLVNKLADCCELVRKISDAERWQRIGTHAGELT